MPNKHVNIEYFINGGWSTDLGNTLAGLQAPQEGMTKLTFLQRADNVVYGLNGSVRKSFGASKFNSSAISGTPTVIGLFEYWKQGTTGSPTRKRVCHAGTVIYKEDVDGTWDSLKTSLVSGTIPDYTVANDKLVISSADATDVPFSWDQSTFQNLAGSPPNFAFSEWHQSRLFASGVVTAPSTIYYSNRNNPETWSGTGSGSITIAPQDGDRITAIISHKRDLIVFKGPYHGSIWRIIGNAPFGENGFRTEPIIKGIGAITHRCVVTMGDDIVFMDVDGTWHGLSATEQFGDFNQKFISRPIDTYIREDLEHSRLDQFQAVNQSDLGIIVITGITKGATTNDVIFGFDYRFPEPRWFRWTNPNAASVAVFKNSSLVDTLYFGGVSDGLVLEGQKSARNWDGAAIGMNVETPHINMGDWTTLKTLYQIRLGLIPSGTFDIDINYIQDGTSQSVTVDQAGAAALDSFVLGIDVLGGASFSVSTTDDVQGEFRSILLQILQSGGDETAEVQSIGLTVSSPTYSGE